MQIGTNGNIIKWGAIHLHIRLKVSIRVNDSVSISISYDVHRSGTCSQAE